MKIAFLSLCIFSLISIAYLSGCDDSTNDSKDKTEISKCEGFGGYCVETAMCDTETFPWYAWGCEKTGYSNCCLPETSSCTALGGQCMHIDNIQDCHDLGYKAANSLDCPGSALTTICCLPQE